MITAPTPHRYPRAGAADGFTMIIALGVLFVTGLLLLASFTAVNGDIHLSHEDTSRKQAYYAARAGVQEYEYKLQVDPNYWQTCEVPSGTVAGETSESYEVTLLPANGAKACNSAKPFETMIESTGTNANTFRIESTGTAGTKKRSIVSTFKVTGFLDYVYFTQYEDEDPYLTKVKNCERYYDESRSSSCQNIEFNNEDSVDGPMHTDDSAYVECSGKVSFGRAEHTPHDHVEINGGMWSSSKTTATKKTSEKPCSSGSPTINTEKGEYEKGAELLPPKSDTSLRAYVESGYEFTGLTTLVLEGEKITVENGGTKKQISWPSNGLIFVQSGAKGCGYEYSQGENASDTSTTKAQESECGSVYVKGTYSKSLTIGAETDLIVNGAITPTGVTAGNAPTGTTVLGLMATRFVRVYHPCTGTPLENLWIYAAILSTSHSFLVDNVECGNMLGDLNVYGAIAQKFRGVVTEIDSSGYIKDYKYDERLATDEPPYFLAPLDAGWKIARETSPTAE
jgi:Tfp pilus assembly protein PilX